MSRDRSWDVSGDETPWEHHALALDAPMERYLNDLHDLSGDPILASLLLATAALPVDPATGLPQDGFGVPLMQGATLAWLVKLTRATRVVELGTFTGMSSLMMARALPEDGELVTIDIDPDTTKIARKFWRKARVEDKITLELRPAAQVLREMGEQNAVIDFAFVDADKMMAHRYLDLLLPLLVPGGLIVFDNVLFLGDVIDPDSPRGEAAVFERFNRLVMADDRVDALLLPLFDGLMAVRKRDR